MVIEVLANDTEADNNIKLSTLQLVSMGGAAGSVASTSRGGTVQPNPDGTVTYTPKQGFAGTDTFKYSIQNAQGQVSNEATVRVNVVKPKPARR